LSLCRACSLVVARVLFAFSVSRLLCPLFLVFCFFLFFFFFLMIRRPPSFPLFPYTTLFRPPHGRRPGAGASRSPGPCRPPHRRRSEEHTSELQSLTNLVCRLLLEKKKKNTSAIKQQTTADTERSITRLDNKVQQAHYHD